MNLVKQRFSTIGRRFEEIYARLCEPRGNRRGIHAWDGELPVVKIPDPWPDDYILELFSEAALFALAGLRDKNTLEYDTATTKAFADGPPKSFYSLEGSPWRHYFKSSSYQSITSVELPGCWVIPSSTWLQEMESHLTLPCAREEMYNMPREIYLISAPSYRFQKDLNLHQECGSRRYFFSAVCTALLPRLNFADAAQAAVATDFCKSHNYLKYGFWFLVGSTSVWLTSYGH